jgi:hypothetical protein
LLQQLLDVRPRLTKRKNKAGGGLRKHLTLRNAEHCAHGGKRGRFMLKIYKMKKLESLADFNSRNLNQLAMGKITGGVVPNKNSGAGSICVPTALSASGCMAYTADIPNTSNGWGYEGAHDINQPC